MREVFLNQESLVDFKALSTIESGEMDNLIRAVWIRFNEKIKLVYQTDSFTSLSYRLEDLNLDEICEIGEEILEHIKKIENSDRIKPGNIVLDLESIYLDRKDGVHLICVPAILPDENDVHSVYKRRIYALLEEMLQEAPGGQEVIRQIEYQMEKQFGDWNSLQSALTRRMPEEEVFLTLRSVNTLDSIQFKIGHEKFRIGTDPGQVDGLIKGAISVSPFHAVIGWNDISFYVMDMASLAGTYLNNQKLTPMHEIPIGPGNILRFGDCTFNVE